MNVIQQLEKEQMKEKVPALRAGDTVKVHAKVVEGTRERIQVFEGTVIRVTGGGLRQNFTVRRVTHGVGVERTFMIHSPRIDKIDVLRHGDVRQGRRPDFMSAAPPDLGRRLYEAFCGVLRANGLTVATGVFGAAMRVQIDADGPVTIVVSTDRWAEGEL